MVMVLSSPPKFVGIDDVFLFDGTYWESAIWFVGRCQDDWYTLKFLSNEEFKLKVEEYKKLYPSRLVFFYRGITTEASKSWYCDSETYLNRTWELSK